MLKMHPLLKAGFSAPEESGSIGADALVKKQEEIQVWVKNTLYGTLAENESRYLLADSSDADVARLLTTNSPEQHQLIKIFEYLSRLAILHCKLPNECLANLMEFKDSLLKVNDALYPIVTKKLFFTDGKKYLENICYYFSQFELLSATQKDACKTELGTLLAEAITVCPHGVFTHLQKMNDKIFAATLSAKLVEFRRNLAETVAVETLLPVGSYNDVVMQIHDVTALLIAAKDLHFNVGHLHTEDTYAHPSSVASLKETFLAKLAQICLPLLLINSFVTSFLGKIFDDPTIIQLNSTPLNNGIVIPLGNYRNTLEKIEQYWHDTFGTDMEFKPYDIFQEAETDCEHVQIKTKLELFLQLIYRLTEELFQRGVFDDAQSQKTDSGRLVFSTLALSWRARKVGDNTVIISLANQASLEDWQYFLDDPNNLAKVKEAEKAGYNILNSVRLTREVFDYLYGLGIRDFRGADFREMDFNNINLRDVNLRGANLTSVCLTLKAFDYLLHEFKIQDFRGVNFIRGTNSDNIASRDVALREANLILDSAHLTREVFDYLYECGIRDFRGADFREMNFDGINLCGVDLRGANLSGIDLTQAKYDQKTQWYGAHITGAKLTKELFKRLIKQGIKDFQQVDFNRMNLSSGSLNGLNLRGANLNGVNLRCANLSESDLREVMFDNTTILSYVTIIKAKLDQQLFKKFIELGKTNFSEVDLSDQDLQSLNLSRLNLNYANLNNANLSGANLGRAKLCLSFLCHAILTNANLQGAFLPGTDLRYAILTNADLRGAYLEGVDLCHANLSGAKLDKKTMLGVYIDSDPHSNKMLFIKPRFAGTKFNEQTFKDFLLLSKSCEELDLSQLNLNGWTLSHLNLRGANLQGTNLQGANLSNTDLRGVVVDDSTEFDDAILHNATIDEHLFKWLVYRGRTDFQQIRLNYPHDEQHANINLSGMQLCKRNFKKANLCYVDFTNTLLHNCNFEGAKLDLSTGLTFQNMTLCNLNQAALPKDLERIFPKQFREYTRLGNEKEVLRALLRDHSNHSSFFYHHTEIAQQALAMLSSEGVNVDDVLKNLSSQNMQSSDWLKKSLDFFVAWSKGITSFAEYTQDIQLNQINIADNFSGL